MADSHDESLQAMRTAAAEALEILREVLRNLPIPVELGPLVLREPEDFDEIIGRVRAACEDMPMPSSAKIHLDLGVLGFMGALDVLGVAHHQDSPWRRDAVLALLEQAVLHLGISISYLKG